MEKETIAKTDKGETISVAIDTLGCKVNQAESENLGRQLAAAGYRLVTDHVADIYILNTCTVTGMADSKARHKLRMMHRRHPGMTLVVTGCYTERAAAELEQIDGVKLIIRNSDKTRLAQILEKSGMAPSQIPLSGQNDSSLPDYYHGGGRTRAFLKVQDGCHNFCSYCIVPLVRSREESMPPEEVIEEVKQREHSGYKEVVITGVEVGSYKFAGVDVKGLLERLLSKTDIPRIRLSSLQPAEITTDLLALWQDRRLCRNFHLSLQSGSDKVLQRMNRSYLTAEYRNAVNLIRWQLPDASITTDIIVGFPGETDEEFQETFDFCEKIDFARIHVFPFSPRKGTQAAGFSDQIDSRTKKLRTENMLKLANNCIKNFSLRFRGQTFPVLFEKKENSLWSGLSDNYIRIYTGEKKDLTNRLMMVQIGNPLKDGATGKIQSRLE